MRNTIGNCVALGATFLTFACSGTSEAPVSRYNFGCVQGCLQAQRAGDSTLGSPVGHRLARDPNGQFAARWYSRLLPANAYAQQTTVSGTGIAGQLIYAFTKPTDPQPWTPYAITDSTGHALFNFSGGTKAGHTCVDFRATLANGTSVVTDSACFNVLPAAPSPSFCLGGYLKPSPYVVSDTAATDAYGNVVAWRLIGDSLMTVHGDTLTWNAALVGNSQKIGTLVMTDTAGATIGHFQYTLTSSSDARMQWKSYGLSATASCSATKLS